MSSMRNFYILSIGKNGNYNIDSITDGILYIYTDKSNAKDIFTVANKYLFKQILQEQEKRSKQLLKNIKSQISILSKQLPELEKLEKAKSNYLIAVQSGKEKFSEQSDIANILHDIYISSAGVQQNQDSLIKLQIKLVDLQHQVASMTPVKLGVVVQSIKPNQIPTEMKIICI